MTGRHGMKGKKFTSRAYRSKYLLYHASYRSRARSDMCTPTLRMIVENEGVQRRRVVHVQVTVRRNMPICIPGTMVLQHQPRPRTITLTQPPLVQEHTAWRITSLSSPPAGQAGQSACTNESSRFEVNNHILVFSAS
jgi:hypothetical protein